MIIENRKSRKAFWLKKMAIAVVVVLTAFLFVTLAAKIIADRKSRNPEESVPTKEDSGKGTAAVEDQATKVGSLMSPISKNDHLRSSLNDVKAQSTEIDRMFSERLK